MTPFQVLALLQKRLNYMRF